MAITLTEAAAQHVTRYLGKRGKGVGVRLGVKTTGCSGLAYKLEYVDEVAPEDIVFEDHGVKVLVDPEEPGLHRRHELDFVREGLNEGFKFNNPNERDRCGCGEASASDRRLRAAQSAAHEPQSQRFRAVRPAASASRRIARRSMRAGRNCSARRIRTSSPRRAQAAQRVAMQWSVRINEAYQRLKEPAQARGLPVRTARRADQCREQHGHAGRFLMEQMEWREALDEAQRRG